ncbi:hypothetical protein F0L74_25775 [Chitinophaga agrisoli]|uniref:Uncharacterized protein n=1 Tax=Chitinophaga agrisoli TaxID=2607653 RepID=A0A5B2VL93_9BACT|nr:hypothetical protein [Chitinophaga agrisoli]KAA2239604.1 hypothetical protein F0L74_25775 [Chitinophaga agrisoli]
MPITEIKNLTNGKSIPNADLTKFDSIVFAETIVLNDITEASWTPLAGAGNIGVTWTNGPRAVGGTLAIDTNKKTATISGLTNVSKYSVDLTGQIEIGPKNSDAVAHVNVRIGNMITPQNLKGDTIIDFSNEVDSTEGVSKLDLNGLISWIKDNGDSGATVELPKLDGDTQPGEFILEFKKFYVNITQKTFDFWVESAAKQSITFGNITIKQVGFRVTNVPTTPAPKEAPKAIAQPETNGVPEPAV